MTDVTSPLSVVCFVVVASLLLLISDLKGDIMRRHPFFLFGWLLAAAVLLSLAGLTAEPLTAVTVDAGQVIG